MEVLELLNIAPHGNNGETAFNWPAFKPKAQFTHLTSEKRYGVAIVLRLTEDNFDIFNGKVGIVEESADNGKPSIPVNELGDIQENFKMLVETKGLNPDQLAKLTTDLKVVVYDRENPLKALELRNWKDVSQEIQEGIETTEELSLI